MEWQELPLSSRIKEPSSSSFPHNPCPIKYLKQHFSKTLGIRLQRTQPLSDEQQMRKTQLLTMLTALRELPGHNRRSPGKAWPALWGEESQQRDQGDQQQPGCPGLGTRWERAAWKKNPEICEGSALSMRNTHQYCSTWHWSVHGGEETACLKGLQGIVPSTHTGQEMVPVPTSYIGYWGELFRKMLPQ